ncbi:MAG: hypothetical protein KGI46_08810 [Alphaproteobacteria bacterium]|nr:hypothetical protein [Alphaproteobacteria bacterium]MDE1930127.1 hypothetical protein [Alphaproteobacteria bacterium]
MNYSTHALPDCNLEAATTLSLKREPACFAFLCSRAVSPPQPIDSLNLDLASVDYFGGRASLWATLEIRSTASDEKATAVLGFDETFLSPFTRALIECAASRVPYRMTIARSEDRPQRLVEYVTGPGVALSELILTPQDNVVVISARAEGQDEETIFQLPRTDTFLRAFAKMTYQADGQLLQTLAQSEKLARQQSTSAA